MLKPTSRSLLRNWWPVVFWLGVIRLESTDLASASNTGGLLYKIFSFVWPRVDPAFVDTLDMVLRKRTLHRLRDSQCAGLFRFAENQSRPDARCVAAYVGNVSAGFVAGGVVFHRDSGDDCYRCG